MNYYGESLPAGHNHEAEPLLHEEKPKPPFMRWSRRRMNVLPILTSVILPWLLFTGVAAAIAFDLHYHHPAIMYVFVGAAALVIFIVGAAALRERSRKNAEREPYWWMFLFISMSLAFTAACVAGAFIYRHYMLGYFESQNLSTYSDIYPNRVSGKQVMDAGSIVFVNGSFVDVKKSMGFKNVDIFCVAPIALAGNMSESYDYWAVGKNCCGGNQADFHCGGFNDATARSGVRLMYDWDRPYYRLAVQQAEATYKITAAHPLFFEWTHDVAEKTDGWNEEGHELFLVLILSFFILHFFIVMCATLAFTKLGTN